MERMGFVLGIRPEAIAEYERLHRETWPEILQIISDAQIRNYSIFLKEPENLLFAYWEYHGSDFAADQARLAAEPRMKDWWALCEPMQRPLETRRPGEWWARMKSVFFKP
jgi:L-rhamnose mutarotase